MAVKCSKCVLHKKLQEVKLGPVLLYEMITITSFELFVVTTLVNKGTASRSPFPFVLAKITLFFCPSRINESYDALSPFELN